MKDRIPTKPNRYAVYDDAHNFIRYEYHERADEPTQEGDALNKANLLPDSVAAALGLTGNPQVKDGFISLHETTIELAATKVKFIKEITFSGTVTSGSEPTAVLFSADELSGDYDLLKVVGVVNSSNPSTTSLSIYVENSYRTIVGGRLNSTEPPTEHITWFVRDLRDSYNAITTTYINNRERYNLRISSIIRAKLTASTSPSYAASATIRVYGVKL